MSIARVLWLSVLVMMLAGCPQVAAPTPISTATPAAPNATAGFANVQSLRAALESGDAEAAWQRVADARTMPLIFGDTAVFLYRGPEKRVGWTGDFSNWSPLTGERLGESDIWWLAQQLPRDARFNYKVVADYKEIRDPMNPITQLEGEGPISALRMPDYVFPAEVLRRDDVPRGTLSEPIIIESAQIRYPVAYQVYTPAGVKPDEPLPAIYVTDGQDFAHNEMGSMVIVLDNLIAEGVIRPVRAVFVDARDPRAGFNRRDEMLGTSDSTVRFLDEELIPAVEAAYPTISSPEARAILGISWGGVLAAHAALGRPERFGLAAIISPYFIPRMNVVQRFEESERLPLKVYLSTGTYDMDVENPRRLREILEAKGYPLRYLEVNDGHGWGNWRGQLDEMLKFFFPPEP
jgi:enterochelin esterase family protein